MKKISVELLTINVLQREDQLKHLIFQVLF